MAPLTKVSGNKKWTYKYMKNITSNFLFEPSNIWIMGLVMMLFEVLLNIVIVENVKYTEIDWKAYMQEVEGFLNGTRDYTKLKGDTGPLVYPAGFVYIYSILYYITQQGSNIKLAQYIFVMFYLINLLLIIRIFRKTAKCPPYVLIFICCSSYRVHSIFVLRLFNDPVAMLILYFSINLFLDRQWSIGCFVFSLAVSIKMNILLFAPGLLVILLIENGILNTFCNLGICFITQVILGLPFLITNLTGYLVRSFDLGRQFFYIWTVNWRLLPESVFLDRKFQLFLLSCHLIFLFLFASKKWTPNFKYLFQLVDFSKHWNNKPGHLCNLKIALILFCSNFIGMCFSRSLHYQFYIWYYHTLPLILWVLPLSTKFRLLLLGIIEMSWNQYPSTVFSSSALHVAHFVILFSLWHSTEWVDKNTKED